jgi:hypothetical protein
MQSVRQGNQIKTKKAAFFRQPFHTITNQKEKTQ